MARCVTCGSELHPERAAKYDYCTRRDCREQNAKGLKILAVGVNKAADQYEVVDGRTRTETAGYEIARKLDLSTGVVIQMLLAAKRQPSSP